MKCDIIFVKLENRGKCMKRKNGKIEFLRFLFALTIMAFHYPTFFKITETAHIGVEFFYIIMGAFMGQKIANEPRKEDDVAKSTMQYIVLKAKIFYVYFIPAFVIKMIITIITDNLGLLSVLDRLVISVPQLLFLNSLGFHTDTYAGAIYVPASWFLSSALIGLGIVYPIAKQNWKMFVGVTAPLITCFSAGYLYMNFGTILVHYNFVNGINVALLRTIMDLSLGCICYDVAQRIKERIGQYKVVTGLEWLLYVVVFFSIFATTPATVEIPILICLAVAVTLTVCKIEEDTFFNHKIFYFLGKVSVPLYLLHCLIIQGMLLVFEDIRNWSMFVGFAVISVGGAMVAVVFAEKWIKLRKKARKK